MHRALFVLALYVGGDEVRVTPEEAAQHVGSRVTVCGKVAGVRYARSARGEPTFLEFGRRYPEQAFTAVIWGTVRARFVPVPERYAGQRVCVTGAVREYRKKPQMVINSPGQVSMDHNKR